MRRVVAEEQQQACSISSVFKFNNRLQRCFWRFTSKQRGAACSNKAKQHENAVKHWIRTRNRKRGTQNATIKIINMQILCLWTAMHNRNEEVFQLTAGKHLITQLKEHLRPKKQHITVCIVLSLCDVSKFETVSGVPKLWFHWSALLLRHFLFIQKTLERVFTTFFFRPKVLYDENLHTHTRTCC